LLKSFEGKLMHEGIAVYSFTFLWEYDLYIFAAAINADYQNDTKLESQLYISTVLKEWRFILWVLGEKRPAN